MAAAPGWSAQALTPQDQADLKRIESYFRTIDTVEARFVQMASNGSFAEGTIYIDRPGRMRIDYAPPLPVEIVADGTWLIYHDKKLGQVSHLWLSSTPAGILLKEDFAFGDDIVVTGFERGPGTMRVTVVKPDDPAAGSLTLVFSNKSLILRKWVIVDALGIETSVTLINARFGGALDSELFRFKAPDTSSND